MIAAPRQRWFFVLGLAAVAAGFLLPQVWLLSLSLKSKAGMFEYPPTWIPRAASVANYRFVLMQSQVPWYLWNSLIVRCLPPPPRSRWPRPRRTCCRASASAVERLFSLRCW